MAANFTSEYKEAQKRFEKTTKDANNGDSSDDLDDDTNHLDDLIQKLCIEEDIDVGQDWTLFYKIIIRADFLQIKNEIIESFYSELWKSFSKNDILVDITNNSHILETIPHINQYLSRAILNYFNLKVNVKDDVMTLLPNTSNEKVANHANLIDINSITLHPNAYKILMSKDESNLIRLNFLLQLHRVKKLNLSGCNLNGQNIDILFHGLQLECAYLSECGTSVNTLIQDNICGILDNLIELDVSKNPLTNKTLISISNIPLKYLNIAHCIKNSGKFFNLIWLADKYASLFNTAGIDGAAFIDNLWEGVLRDSIEILNVCGNNLTKTNLELILKLQLRELDITGSLKAESVSLSGLVFPSSLKVLKAQLNEFHLEDLNALCNSCLEKLEMRFYEERYYDYSNLKNSPITRTLRELSISVSEANDELTSFISTLNLKVLRCSGVYMHSDNGKLIGDYITNFKLDRNCLEVLEIGGPNLRISNSDEFFTAFGKLQNLKVLSLHSTECYGHPISSFLRCENLHTSLETLELNDNYMIKNNDLLEIVKFKKLTKLKFSFSHNISYNNFKNVVQLHTLKELIVSASVIGTIKMDFALMLSLVPIKMLRLCRVGITEEAWQRLKNSNNFAQPATLIAICCNFTTLLANLLGKFNWEEIILLNCAWTGESANILIDNENLNLSCNHFSSDFHIRNYWTTHRFEDIMLSKFRFGDKSLDENDQRLSDLYISKFLFCLSIGKIERNEDVEALRKLFSSNLSIVDRFGLDPRALVFAKTCLDREEYNRIFSDYV